ncbi:MAG: Macrolide export ATP-binding/permease protein MacB [candidate division TA06 bacterium ADurb.Bin131]|uniref:Macrolide export ATP-binding/permease protein MacB n=1 Tax=candidate division TA06 bacterium ADurb.Bin131 TaxID=1852827 RepID=A0A1V6CF12_UNCT6|nr:MAG: Macrolide export ATP-binding/permease protein MacB [candidate division TA06 bacterium ADurb.Bin131]HOC03590.1 ABC transporter permease [bacterium]
MLWSAIVLALGAIKRNLMRSLLTVLGIEIGVAAVIILVTIGNGTTAQVQKQIASMGSNLLMVSPGKRMGPGRSTATPFKAQDAQAIAAEISSVSAVAPIASQALTAVYGNENWSTSVVGTDNNYLYATNRAISEGRPFSESEMRAGAAVCIIGETVRKNLFGGEDAVGKNIRLGKISFEVIGILQAKGQAGMGMDQDDTVIIPLRTLQRRITGNQDINLIMVAVQDSASTSRVQRDIEWLMRERRHITAAKEDDFTVMDTKEIAETLTSTTKMLTSLLAAVAAVSLLVGGIGIMNIMLVSVTERTREIGTRLAIGALEREVLFQFLVEAVILSSFGGICGIAVALAASAWLAGLMKIPYVFSFGIIALSFLFSVAVGVIFGYFPALKAARMNPIEALRYE